MESSTFQSEEEPVEEGAEADEGAVGRSRQALDALRLRLRRDEPPPVTPHEARAAAYFLSTPPHWIVRHVETYELENLGASRRRRTIDLELPEDSRAIVRRARGRSVYLLPLARMPKATPVPFIDLRDEEGRVLHLRTINENGELTCAALGQAIRIAADGQEMPEGFDDTIRRLVFSQERPEADTRAVWIRNAVGELAIPDQQVVERINHICIHLILNSIIWVELRGVPHEHRVLKLATNISLAGPALPARRRRDVEVEVDGQPVPWKEDGRIAVRDSLRAIRAWLSARIGWDSLDIEIRDPAIQDPASYHLQVSRMDGLRVDRIEFAPDRRPHETHGLQPKVNHGHFYLRDPRRSLSVAIPLQVSIRVARRGLLNTCMLSTGLVVALLWCYQASKNQIQQSLDHGAVAAAVLLVVPPFVALVFRRTSEGSLSTTLLSGVRAVTIGCNVVAAMAAAAITGIRATQTLSATLIIYAIVASAGCGVVLIAWLASFRWIRRTAESSRRWWCGSDGDRRDGSWLVIMGLTVAMAGLGELLDERAARHGVRAAVPMVALALALLVSAGWPQFKRIPPGARILAVLGATAGVAWCLTAVTVLGVELPRHPARRIAELTIAGTFGWALLTLTALVLAPVPRAPEASTDAPEEAGDQPSDDEAPTQTPDATDPPADAP